MKPNAIMMMLGGILLMSVAFLGDTETPDKPDDPVIPGVDDGRRVLIVYESEDKPTYPIGQAMVLDSATSANTSRRNVIPTAGDSRTRTWTRHTWPRPGNGG
jgi:hypothetical protein